MLGVLVVGQFTLAFGGILPGLDAELTPVGYMSLMQWPDMTAHAYGEGAWVLLGVLVVVLLAALREKGRTSVLVGLLVLAVTAPLVTAGPFAVQLAAASALRWGLAVCYLACAVVVWLRRPLARLANSAGIMFAADSSALVWAHSVLAVLAATVLLLTGQVAVLGFSGLRPSGPAAGSFFANIGWTVSHVVPLLVLTLGMIGHGVRERSPLYAFLAGLVANLSVAGGYALAVVKSGRHLGTADLVCLWQLVSLTAGLWALAWMSSLPWLRRVYGTYPERASIPSPLGVSLMSLKVGIALVGQSVLIVIALFFRLDWSGPLTAWAAAAGSGLGWASLCAGLAALTLWYRQQDRPPPWGWLFTGGLAAVSLLACTVERTWPGSGLYFLLLGWPLYVLLWSVLPGMRFVPRSAWLSFAGFTEAAPVVLLPNLATLLWAMSVAIGRQDYLWAATAVSLCSAAAAVLAAAATKRDTGAARGSCGQSRRFAVPLAPVFSSTTAVGSRGPGERARQLLRRANLAGGEPAIRRTAVGNTSLRAGMAWPGAAFALAVGAAAAIGFRSSAAFDGLLHSDWLPGRLGGLAVVRGGCLLACRCPFLL